MILLIRISQLPVLTLTILAFILFVAFRIRHLESEEKQTDEEFWENERHADLTPARDLNTIQYITIPLEKFPLSFFDDNPDEEADMIIDELRQLSSSRLLNLNGMSNTDLKLQYGRKNLGEMQQIGERFNRVEVLLCDLAKCFMEKKEYQKASCILEYAIGLGSDVSADYTLLGECYRVLSMPDKFEALYEKVESMDLMTKGTVLREFDRIRNEK